MKTNLKLTAVSLLMLPLFLGTAFAQEKKESHKAIIKIKKVDDENGTVTEMDTTFILKDKSQLKEILHQHGLNSETNETIDAAIKIELDEMGEGNRHYVIKEIEEDENGDVKKHIRVLKMDLDENGEMDEETRAKVEEALKMAKEKLEFHSKDGEGGENVFIFKSEDGEPGQSMKYEFKADGDDGREMIVKTVVIEEDENGNIEKKVFETKSSHAMIFIRKSDDGEEGETKKRMRKDLPMQLEEEQVENLNLKNLKLYPNPSNGEFTMTFKSKEPQDLNLSISNAKGEVLFNKDLRNFKGKFEEKFDWANQPKGIYFFNLKSGEENESRKIILQ